LTVLDQDDHPSSKVGEREPRIHFAISDPQVSVGDSRSELAGRSTG